MTTAFNDPFTQFRQQGGFSFGGPAAVSGPFDPFTGLPSNQQVPPINTLNSPFADFFEEQPRIPFHGALQRANLTPNQKDFFRTQADEVFNQYLGTLDNLVRSGQDPTLRVADFVGNYDFDRAFRDRPPSARSSSQFAPPVRVLGRR